MNYGTPPILGNNQYYNYHFLLMNYNQLQLHKLVEFEILVE